MASFKVGDKVRRISDSSEWTVIARAPVGLGAVQGLSPGAIGRSFASSQYYLECRSIAGKKVRRPESEFERYGSLFS